MKNLKIKTKLLVGFGIVLVMLILLGVMSFDSIGRINDVVNDFSTKTVPDIASVWQMRRAMQAIQKNLALATASTEYKDIEEAITECNLERSSLTEAVDAFKKNSQLDPSYMERFEAIIKEAADYRVQIYDLARENTTESSEHAFRVLHDQYSPTFDKAIDVLKEITDEQLVMNIQQDEDAKSAYTSAVISIITVFVISLIVVIVMVVVITKSIVGPVNELEQAAKEIANGNLNVNIRQQGKDEVAMLAASFIKVKDTIRFITEKINEVALALKSGDIDARIDNNLFNGDFEDTTKAINNIIDDYIDEVTTLLGAYGELGNGNFNVALRKLPGKKILANESFDALKNNLKSVSTDVTNLIVSAVDGKIDQTIDTSIYNGGWKELTEGLNSLLKAVSEPIDEANNVLAKLSAGDFNVNVNKNFKGSFAFMMNAFDSMIKSTGSYISEITQILDLIAHGDLRGNISREYVGQFNLIKNSINNIGQTLKNTISDIRSSSESVLAGAKQISETSMDLANGASTQANTVEQLSASIMVINEKTKKTANDSQSANEISQHSIQSAKQGSAEMQQMLISMDEIKTASNSISSIIKVIDGIAFQTNLLALNAAVEAARAGEQGKGFGVVASEVRSLAARSAQSAKDTAALIEDTINKINSGTIKAKATADSLEKIVESVSAVTETIAKINDSTKEQSLGISQITIGINQISEVVQSNSSTSEESASAAQELNSMASVLNDLVDKFKL